MESGIDRVVIAIDVKILALFTLVKPLLLTVFHRDDARRCGATIYHLISKIYPEAHCI